MMLAESLVSRRHERTLRRAGRHRAAGRRLLDDAGGRTRPRSSRWRSKARSSGPPPGAIDRGRRVCCLAASKALKWWAMASLGDALDLSRAGRAGRAARDARPVRDAGAIRTTSPSSASWSAMALLVGRARQRASDDAVVQSGCCGDESGSKTERCGTRLAAEQGPQRVVELTGGRLLRPRRDIYLRHSDDRRTRSRSRPPARVLTRQRLLAVCAALLIAVTTSSSGQTPAIDNSPAAVGGSSPQRGQFDQVDAAAALGDR